MTALRLRPLLRVMTAISGTALCGIQMGCGAPITCAASMTSYTTSRYMSVYGTTNGPDLAQRFTVTTTTDVSSIQLPLSRVGTFSSASESLSVMIEATDATNTSPSGISVASSIGTVEARSLVTNLALVTFTFSASATLTAGTNYWIRLNAGNLTQSTTKYIRWHGSAFDVDTNHLGKFINAASVYQPTAPSNGVDPYDFGYRLECI